MKLVILDRDGVINEDSVNFIKTPNEWIPIHSKEVRLMEKVDENWKIVNVSAFWNYKNRIPISDI